MKRLIERHGNGAWSVRLEVGRDYTHKGVWVSGIDDVPHPAAVRAMFRIAVKALRIQGEKPTKRKLKQNTPQETLWR